MLEVSSLIMTGWLGAGSFVAFIQAQLLELIANVFRRIVIEPPKGRMLSKLHETGSVQRATTQSPGNAQPLTSDGGGGEEGAALPMPKEAAKEAFKPPPRIVSAEDADSLGEANLPAGLRHTLVIWCTDTTALYVETLMVTMMFLFRAQFEVEKLYGLRARDQVEFMNFLYFLIPVSWIEDVFTNNINEALYKWDTTGYMQRQAAKYARRRHLWALSAPAADERLHPWERIDRVLMTNQLWLLLMLYGASGAVVMLGYLLMQHQSYNCWCDPMFVPLVLAMRIYYVLCRKILIKIFRWISAPKSAAGSRGTWRV